MPDRADLIVQNLTVRFGGAVAVDDLSLAAPEGRITGLIGPNGAGKTTTFNACTGLVRPSSGRVELGGRDITGASPPQRAQLGLGRTFQRMELFDSLSVARNVEVAREAVIAGRSPWRHLVCSRANRRIIEAAAADALERCGLAPLAARAVGGLSTGQRRLVELARVVAGGFRLLLLDEPSSGLDHDETAAFGRVLTSLVAERGIGVLLVEHDMALVMAVCEHLFVLDFGQLIFEGSGSDARQSALVREAYLGSTA